LISRLRSSCSRRNRKVESEVGSSQDDPAQSRRANEFIAASAARGEPLHLSAIVLCETVWVLRWAYGVATTDILRTLSQILETAQFAIEDGEAFHEVLPYAAGAGDFSDYLIGRRNRRASCSATVTFDRKLRRSGLFRIL
jgi:predicted nucleic-acid-binding protein